MKVNNDLRKILTKEHEEKWVAMNKQQTKVIDFAKELTDLRSRIGKEKQEIVYFKVPRSDTMYAF